MQKLVLGTCDTLGTQISGTPDALPHLGLLDWELHFSNEQWVGFENLLFGMGRKATGRTELLCPRLAVFVKIPGDM